MKWLLQNIRACKLHTQESAICPIDEGELTFSDEGFLARICGVSPRSIRDSWMNPAVLLNLLRISPTSLMQRESFTALVFSAKTERGSEIACPLFIGRPAKVVTV
jgi:hypothetical protein